MLNIINAPAGANADDCPKFGSDRLSLIEDSDLSSCSVRDLVAIIETMKLLQDVATGSLENPWLSDAGAGILDAIHIRLGRFVDAAADVLKARHPLGADERNIRWFALLAYYASLGDAWSDDVDRLIAERQCVGEG